MELFWYIVLGSMLAIYVVLDGYDFGVGILHLFLAKKEEDKRLFVKAIGPFWDANEVWLIAAGGILFFAFPKVYASAFSGFYLPLIIVLWLLIFRAVGLELRGQVHHPMWEGFWDRMFGIASMLLALFFGTALGNVIRGVNLGGVENGVSAYDPHNFFLPLWNQEFSPNSVHLGVIDWFTVLIGVIAVVTLAIHGGNWLVLKTNSALVPRIKKLIFRLTLVLSVLIVVSFAVWSWVSPNPFRTFFAHPVLWGFPLIALIGLVGLFRVEHFKKEYSGFVASTLFLVGALASSFISIFPMLLPSTNKVNPSLTIYNASAGEYGLQVGIYWWIIAAILVVVYMIVQYKIFRGKMDDVDYGH